MSDPLLRAHPLPSPAKSRPHSGLDEPWSYDAVGMLIHDVEEEMKSNWSLIYHPYVRYSSPPVSHMHGCRYRKRQIAFTYLSNLFRKIPRLNEYRWPTTHSTLKYTKHNGKRPRSEVLTTLHLTPKIFAFLSHSNDQLQLNLSVIHNPHDR